MTAAPRKFQVFVKPTGALCNLDCKYCYYLEKTNIYHGAESFRMPPDVLQEYIIQHIQATQGDEVRFSWHGGEPTILGVDFFRRIVDIQKKYRSPTLKILNGIQTNGTLINDEWCRFLAENGFAVGISLDGPREIHDRFRRNRADKPTFSEVMRGYTLLKDHGVPTEILCVVNGYNVQYPLEVYRFFQQLNAPYITFLPLVEHRPEAKTQVSDISVQPDLWGKFLCTIFDEWMEDDIERIRVQIFEEALRTAFNQEHSLCIFRPVCGDVPVVEHNGDFYSCDHFVDEAHLLGNIMETPLGELLDDPRQRAFGEAKSLNLPRYCVKCEVRTQCNGECPKNRFLTTPDGEGGLNYLCEGYRRFFKHCQPFVLEVASLCMKDH